MPDCGFGSFLGDNGGGVCATSTSGSGGLVFSSMSNIYDDNSADFNGGGVAVISGGGGDITFLSGNDAFTNNLANTLGGGISLGAEGESLDATIEDATIGGPSPFPLGGNRAGTGGGIAIRSNGGSIVVSNQGNLTCNSP